MLLPAFHTQLFLSTQTLTTYAHGSFQLTTHTSAEGEKMCSGKHTHVCMHTYTNAANLTLLCGYSQVDGGGSFHNQISL